MSDNLCSFVAGIYYEDRAAWSDFITKHKDFFEKELISKSANLSTSYAYKTDSRFELGEQSIAKSAEKSYKYALNTLHNRFELGENSILKSAKYSSMYSMNVIKDRWLEAEKTILEKKNIDVIIEYAVNCMKKRWIEAEDIIIKGSKAQIVYYTTKLGQRWEEVEPIILKNGSESIINYAENCIKGRWIEAEKKFLETTQISNKLEYCEKVLKGRWKEFEDLLFEIDSVEAQAEYVYEYAKNVIKGKLPETLHNKMIMTYSMNREDEFLVKYFKAKKYKVEKENKIKLYITNE